MPVVRSYPVGTLELMKVGRVWIIESLGENGLHTGRALREHLEDIFSAKALDIPVTFREVGTKAEFMACLEELRTTCLTSTRGVILDIETHGFDDQSGLQLKDGSEIDWDELKPRFQAINLATRFNLLLMMSCCNGGYFGVTARLEEVAVSCAYIGPNTVVSCGELVDGLKTFFTALFSGMDASDALTAVRQQWPNFPYFYSTAAGLFRLGAEGYIRDETTPRRLRERARRQIGLMKLDHRPDVPSINELVRRLKALEKPYMERAIRTYFALDQFPDVAERFPVTYVDLFSAAHRRP